MKKRSGFSLVELIIVIVIVGILIASIVGLRNMKEVAKAAVVQQQALQMKDIIDKSMRDEGFAYYMAFFGTVNDYDAAELAVTNSYTGEIPSTDWGNTWKYRVVNISTADEYSERLELTIPVPQGVCPSLVNKMQGQVTSASCEPNLTPFAAKGNFHRLILNFDTD